ncbi:glycosyltransferase family 2 protein [Geobacter sulfurreducens]|uniref:glycosyltransferase family 2 protein n=1 Tax=Geobacter sulfurreducens TaxID=35554 RepID=UPI0009E30763|nr:glycosyltransferase family 2 protein [Geobacter sulfurreducens]QVW36680.1 glycosyltransferase family 2 protein [Geobacter sulfurreducens]
MKTNSEISPIISVVVCTYNRAELLNQCLRSLAEQSLDSMQYEVIIVDNNSTDNTREIVTRYLEDNKHFRCVSEPRQGLSIARNKGLQEAQGRYLAFIDDDAKASPNWLELIVNAFETVRPLPAAVGGEIRPFYEVPPPYWFSDDFELRSWGSESKFLEYPASMFGFSGSNMAFPKHILCTYGGFDDTLGMKGAEIGLGEEADLFFRMYQSQAPLWYDPAIQVFHWTPVRNTTVAYRMKRAYCAGRSRAKIVGSTLFSAETVHELLRLPAFVLISLVLMIRKEGARRTELMKFMQILFNRLGYLAGRIS